MQMQMQQIRIKYLHQPLPLFCRCSISTVVYSYKCWPDSYTAMASSSSPPPLITHSILRPPPPHWPYHLWTLRCRSDHTIYLISYHYKAEFTAIIRFLMFFQDDEFDAYLAPFRDRDSLHFHSSSKEPSHPKPKCNGSGCLHVDIGTPCTRCTRY